MRRSLLILLAALAGCAPAAGTRVEFLRSTANEALGLPFSEAVRVGDLLLLSGQIGNVPGNRSVVAGGAAAEARQTLDNIRATLERFGSSLSEVVKCTVFLLDMADYATVNEVYAEYFPQRPPARSAVAGSGLALGARVEIECIAVYGA